MAESTAKSVKGTGAAVGINLVEMEFTKAGATDTITIPAGYGTTVVWASVVKKSTGVPDDPTAISGLEVTLSTGTGVMRGLFIVE